MTDDASFDLIQYFKDRPGDEALFLQQATPEAVQRYLAARYPEGVPARVGAAMDGVSRATYYRRRQLGLEAIRQGMTVSEVMDGMADPRALRQQLGLGPVNKASPQAKALKALQGLSDSDLATAVLVEVNRRFQEDEGTYDTLGPLFLAAKDALQAADPEAYRALFGEQPPPG